MTAIVRLDARQAGLWLAGQGVDIKLPGQGQFFLCPGEPAFLVAVIPLTQAQAKMQLYPLVPVSHLQDYLPELSRALTQSGINLLYGHCLEQEWPAWERIGAEFSSCSLWQRIELDGIDAAALTASLPSLPNNLTLHVWNNRYPKNGRTFARLYSRFKTWLGHEYREYTTDGLRHRAKKRRRHNRGFKTIVLYRGRKAIAFSEVTWQNGEHGLRQRSTGVLPKWRGQGLATWLKIKMLLALKEEFAAGVNIITVNDRKNLPILGINRRLGFTVQQERVHFILPLR